VDLAVVVITKATLKISDCPTDATLMLL